MDMRLEDRAQIGSLLTRYCEDLDDYDIDAVADVFTEDYTFDAGPGNGGALQGRDVIVAAQRERMARWRRSHHQLGQSRIDFDGPDEAHGTTYVIAWHQSWENVVGTARLRYLDRFVRRDGRWLISYRQIIELGVEGFPEGTWSPSGRRIPPGH